MSDDLVAMFSKELGNDLRFGSWLGIYKDPWNAVYKVRKLVDDKDGMVSSECLLRLSEVFLNKAEALAMLSREDEAMNLIEELRVKRMKQGHILRSIRERERSWYSSFVTSAAVNSVSRGIAGSTCAVMP